MTATFTRDGVIPHLKVKTVHGVVLAPVKLAIEPHGNGHRIVNDHSLSIDRRLPVPMRRDGKLVFALPGGLEVLA